MKTRLQQSVMGLFLMLMLSCVIAGGAGCGKKPGEKASGQTGKAKQSAAKLSISINSWIGWAPLYLAKAKGLMGDTDLSIARVEDTGARKSSMIAGHVDGYASSVDNFALESAEGVDGKIVLCFDESSGADGIVAKRKIKTAKDLKGVKIAFQKGLPSHFLLLTVLKEAGLSPSDVIQVDMDADKAGAAFAAGQLDAAVTWEPWISKAAEMADGGKLVTTRDFPGLIVDTLVFRNEVIQRSAGSVQDVVAGWFKALSYWRDHQDEADKIMADAYGLPVAEFKAMCAGVKFYDLPRNKEYFGSNEKPGPIYSVFASAADLWIASGIITRKSESAKEIDSSFIGNMK